MSGPQAFAIGYEDNGGPAVRTGRQMIEDLQAPLDSFPRGLDKIRAAMEAMDAADAHKAEVARYNAQAETEAALMHQAAQDRIDVLTRGRPQREIAAEEAEREQVRQARISELVGELARLAPEVAAKLGGVSRSAGPDMFVTMADGSMMRLDSSAGGALSRQRSLAEQVRRGREAGRDEFMLREVVAFDKRQAERQDAIRRAEIADFEREYSEIVR